jgi:hypothetical protein
MQKISRFRGKTTRFYVLKIKFVDTSQPRYKSRRDIEGTLCVEYGILAMICLKSIRIRENFKLKEHFRRPSWRMYSLFSFAVLPAGVRSIGQWTILFVDMFVHNSTGVSSLSKCRHQFRVTEMFGRNEGFRVKGSSVGVHAEYSFRA